MSRPSQSYLSKFPNCITSASDILMSNSVHPGHSHLQLCHQLQTIDRNKSHDHLVDFPFTLAWYLSVTNAAKPGLHFILRLLIQCFPWSTPGMQTHLPLLSLLLATPCSFALSFTYLHILTFLPLISRAYFHLSRLSSCFLLSLQITVICKDRS